MYSTGSAASLARPVRYPHRSFARFQALMFTFIVPARHFRESDPVSCIEARSYAAYSIRPRIQKLLPQFLKPVPPVKLQSRLGGPVRQWCLVGQAVPPVKSAESRPAGAAGLSLSGQVEDLPYGADIDHTVPPSPLFGVAAWKPSATCTNSSQTVCGATRPTRTSRLRMPRPASA